MRISFRAGGIPGSTGLKGWALPETTLLFLVFSILVSIFLALLTSQGAAQLPLPANLNS